MSNRWWKGTLLLAILAMLAIACGDAEEEAPTTTQAPATTQAPTTTAAMVEEEPMVDLSVPPDEPKGGLIRIGATPVLRRPSVVVCGIDRDGHPDRS